MLLQLFVSAVEAFQSCARYGSFVVLNTSSDSMLRLSAEIDIASVPMLVLAFLH